MLSPFFYDVQFMLTEMSGKTGATIGDIRVSTVGESQLTGPGCWRETIRVAPGETLDYFDTQYESLLYCAPGVGSRIPVSSVDIIVSFKDDEGRVGTVTGSATVTR